MHTNPDPGTEAPVIECRGLAKTFRDFWHRPRVKALNGIDLLVRPREVFGLLGPNGSGKSTTIKLLLGLLHPTAGRVSIFGRHPSDVEIKSRIGYLPEESYLYRFLNARETLEYYARLFNLSRPERRRRIDMLLEMVGLEAVQRRPVGEYSKGMQRRIGLAQALVNDPDLLILDEPTTGLDPIGTRQIKDLILHLKSRGKTVLLCSHLLADVEDVCDRVTILYGGTIRALGTVDELLTETDAVVFETEKLGAAEIEKVRILIEHAANAKVRKVDAPRKRMESLFLEIVERARAEGAQTYGAGAGGPVAGFLGEGALPDAPPAATERVEPAPAALKPDAAVVAELTRPAPRLEPAPEPAPAAPPPEREAVLEELVQAPGAKPPAPQTPAAPAKLETAVLDELLGRPPASKPKPQAGSPPGAPPQPPAKPLLDKDARVNRDLLDDLLGKDRKE